MDTCKLLTYIVARKRVVNRQANWWLKEFLQQQKQARRRGYTMQSTLEIWWSILDQWWKILVQWLTILEICVKDVINNEWLVLARYNKGHRYKISKKSKTTATNRWGKPDQWNTWEKDQSVVYWLLSSDMEGGVAEWFRALELKSGGPWFKSSTLLLAGFVLGSPEFNTSGHAL